MEEDYKNFKKEFTALEMRVVSELPTIHSQITILTQNLAEKSEKAELSLLRTSLEGIKKSVDNLSQRMSILEASKIKWWQR